MSLKVVIDKAGYRMTELGLETKRQLHFEEWEMLGQYLGEVHRGLQWALGDWLAYAESQSEWGDKYSQAIEVTGLDYQTLANYRWVASRIPHARRRLDVSWTHHCIVAGLDHVKADAWLAQAAKMKWTTAELRAQVKEYEHKDRKRVKTGEGGRSGGSVGSAPTPRPELSLLERMKEDYLTLSEPERCAFVEWLQQFHGVVNA